MEKKDKITYMIRKREKRLDGKKKTEIWRKKKRK